MAVCVACSQPLVVEVDPEEDFEAGSSAAGPSQNTVPDDLELPCHCHFHWQCLFDQASQVAIELTCPSCNSPLASSPSGPSATNTLLPPGSSAPQILTRYINEGGVQDSLDILPLITEEAYLEAHPEARPARAFLTMCGEGDASGVVGLLASFQEEEQEEGEMSVADILRYQDPLDNLKSALHVGIEKAHHEVVWMLLWLASSLPSEAFPEEVTQVAGNMGIGRETATAGQDIRLLKDENGYAAGKYAEKMGETWRALLAVGILSPN